MADTFDWQPSPPPEGWGQASTGNKPVQEAEVLSPSLTPPMPQAPNEFQGLPVRAGGDRVFILKEGKRHWVSTPEAFARLGFKLGDERRIDQATLSVLPEGEIIK
jgi:hypothetical protein